MSESPKMGLFGSKDETKEIKKNTKDESPDRYAPYCIDSDSETYDTEALSIMDINDIIGVQSDPVSDSTLESEIAALSQMITESKTDGTQNVVGTESETYRDDESKNEEFTMMENSDVVQMSNTAEELKPALEQLQEVCSIEEAASVEIKQSGKGNIQFNSENILPESFQLCKQQKDNSESNLLIGCASVCDAKVGELSNISNEVNIDVIQASDDSVSVTSEAVRNKENVNRLITCGQEDSNIEKTTVNSEIAMKVNENSICGSLKLIGDAYSSEDSQESTANNEESKLTSVAISFNQHSLIDCAEKNDPKVDHVLQLDVNKVVEKADNINSDKSCIDEDINNAAVDSEKLCTIEVDSSNVSAIPECTEELFIRSEDAKDAANECKVGSLSNIVSAYGQQSIDIHAIEISHVEKKILQETIIDNEIGVNERDDKPIVNSVAQSGTSEDKIIETNTETNKNEETVTFMDTEREKDNENKEKENIQEHEKIINALEIKSNIVNKAEVLNIETGYKVNADTDGSPRESELQVEPMRSEIEPRSIDNPATNVSDKDNSLQVPNIKEVSNEKAGNVETVQVSEGMDTEELNAVETELNEELKEPISNQSLSNTSGQTSIASTDDSIPIIQSCSDHNIVNKDDNEELNIKIENEEKKYLNSVSPNMKKIEIKEGVIAEPIETIKLCTTQEKTDEGLKLSESASSDTTSKCKAPMEIDIKVEFTTPMVKTDLTEDAVNPMVINTLEGSLEMKVEEPMEENNDKGIEEMNVEVQSCAFEKLNPESIKTENAVIKNMEPTIISESNNIEIFEVREETEVKELITEEKIISEEQTEEKIILKEQTETKIVVEEKMEEKIIAEEQTEEMIIVEEQTDEKIIVQEQTEKKIFAEEPMEGKMIAEEQTKEMIIAEDQTEEKIVAAEQTEEKIIAEEQTGEKIITEEQTEGQIIAEEQKEEKIMIVEQTEGQTTDDRQTNEKDVVEEQMEDKVTTEEQVEDMVIIKEQIEEKVTSEKQAEAVVTKIEVNIVEQFTLDEQTTEIVPVAKELEEEKTTEEEMLENKKEDSVEVNVGGEQSSEVRKGINQLEDDRNAFLVAKEDTPESSQDNILDKEENVMTEEAIEDNSDLSSSCKIFKKDLFSQSAVIIAPKVDAREGHMEGEMNLSIELQETESQSEISKNDIQEGTQNKKDVQLLQEIIKQDQKESVLKIDDSLNVEHSSTTQMEIEESAESNVVEEPVLNKHEELVGQQQVEDNDSKNDSDKDNLEDILERTNNVEEMLPGEKCQPIQNIVTSILGDTKNATDFENILGTEAGVSSKIEKVLQQSENLPLVESEMEELIEKLPQDSEDTLNKDIDMDTISNQNIDSLEGLLGLGLMPDGVDSALSATKTEEQLQKSEPLSKVVDASVLLEQSNHSSDMTQAADYITHVISSCLTDRNAVSLEDINREKFEPIKIDNDAVKNTKLSSMLKAHEAIISETVDKVENDENLSKDSREDTDMPENELVMDFEETPLESVDDLEETDSKLELASDILLQNVDRGENLHDAPTAIETSQPSSEISELESAVKFLQESEEQAMDSPLVLSPKIVESVVDDISKQAATSSLFVPDEDMCDNAELDTDLQNIATDSISISEAEIISEAAKLESERKLAEQIKIDASKNRFRVGDRVEINENIVEEKITTTDSFKNKLNEKNLQNIEMQQTANPEKESVSETIATVRQHVLKASESIPKISILEERLKEPPKIEIPSADVTKVSMSPTTSKDSLLIQKDAKLLAYQKMLESPKLSDKSEPRIVETPRKDHEKHDFENVGSPRIILKIAKSAITDCGEPRSPKSPKIRSATNSPNPEDSPGQKLGKIKLKLSKGGHPSIISNENVEEVGQWYSEGSSSLSPIGMKIKLSKLGDASIVSSEKYDTVDDSKEGKHKYEENKRTESPIGMKIKLSKSGDASIVQQDCKELQMKHKDKLDMVQGSPKRTESPIGMKIKLSKTGDASIIQPERQDILDEYKENSQVKSKEKHESCYNSPKRTDSPIGMKIKLSKTGDASIVSPDFPDENKESGTKVKDKFESSPEIPKRTDSPIGMKIKLAKTKGGASIISVENTEETKDKLEVPDIPKRTESPLGMKIKLSKTGDASIIHSEVTDEIRDKVEATQDAATSSESSSGMKIKVSRSGEIHPAAQESFEESLESVQEAVPKVDSPLGMKIKFSKFGDASIVPSERQEQVEESRPIPETPKRTDSPLGMKIKLSKSGDASIIQPEISEDANKIMRTSETEHSKTTDGTLGMKIKLLKTGDASIVDSEKKDRQQRRRDTETHLEMKIRLSKTGHPTIVACDNQIESGYKSKEGTDPSQNFSQRYKESGQVSHKEPALKILKTGHSTILQSNRSELTIEPIQIQGKKPDNVVEISPKRKDVTISPIESKKSKLEAQLTQILPEVTIQPVTSREQKQFLFDPKSNSISLQQMNVINQEISITQVRPQKPADPSMSEKLKDILSKNVSGSPMNSDCEIIEHRSELIIVNENSNSSQDVMIIEEVSPTRMPEVKVPKKRGRPRRNPLPPGIIHPPPHMLVPRNTLSLDETQSMQQPQVPHFAESRENERPKRTCRSQKSYAPPKRGRGRGRGKRKMESVDLQSAKKPRIEQDISAIEASTTAIITLADPTMQQESFGKSPELYKALKQPALDSKIANTTDFVGAQSEMSKIPEMRLPKPISNDSKDSLKDKKLAEMIPERVQKVPMKDDKGTENVKLENRDILVPPGHPNWLTPVSKRAAESATKHENVSTVQVIDEETRMSAESGSRSQTPARNISAPASETIVNEESQGSVLSTATTESEKVKVKNRRMEINFDPDEGPFTVDKIAEYEWPLDRKGETFMIQEQISQYLGVKSFKRKYPDLKRRVVDMEERNYLRENGLVSEAMCDMGLTAVCSSEVLDVMCSDFPDQYEEYRKHMREKQVKEHSKKQKELTAAANAEKNRIDLAEMAVQSALSWNISLNKARRESRKCSLDLQTFTIHVPKKQQKVETERRIGHYPVALIPGQYTDYYREYTPAELRYYPLNTVLYGPMRPNERKFDSQSEGSQSDSDSDSSSDDSSSSSSEGTQDTEGSQSTMDDVDMEIANQKDEIKLKCKMCLKALNKHSKNEVLIQCGTCNGHVHPSCIDLTLDMVPHIQSYAWQCTDCKTCAQCHDPADEDKMLFCDMCDRGYHIYCVGLRRVPQGRWHCQECAVCANCGSREPGGVNSDRNSVAQWQHEYKKGDKNTRVYVSTLCVPCSKLWRKGRYCPHCSRCHTAPRLDLEANLVHCSACDKYLHLGCVETKGVPLDRKNYLCDFCAPNRQQMVKPLVSKTFKT